MKVAAVFVVIGLVFAWYFDTRERHPERLRGADTEQHEQSEAHPEAKP
jgi:hypothetical protein